MTSTPTAAYTDAVENAIARGELHMRACKVWMELALRCAHLGRVDVMVERLTVAERHRSAAKAIAREFSHEPKVPA